MNMSPTQTQKVQIILFAANGSLELLLMQLNRKRGGGWQNITGAVDPQEKSIDAACREVKEETGLTLTHLLELPLAFTFTDRWQRHVSEKCFYGIIPWDLKSQIKIDPQEHQAFQWKAVDSVTSRDYRYPSNYEAFQSALSLHLKTRSL